MSDNNFTVDKILNINVEFTKYQNEINALIQLQCGICTLYNNVKNIEKIIMEDTNGKGCFFMGEHPLIPSNLNSLLPCFFHWFGISVCNYSRLVGIIVSMEQGHLSDSDLGFAPNRTRIKKACSDYTKSVVEIQELIKWRNKVAAHFALTDPKNEDNIATLEASIFNPVQFENDRFKTGVFVITKFDEFNSETSEIPKWSITELFEDLSKRYWPNFQINNVN